MNTRRHDHLKGIIVGALAIAATSGIVCGDVLYDSLHYSDDGVIDQAISTFIGGQAIFGSSFDVQGADDFTLTNIYNITGVTADFAAGIGLTPADGVLVEFFADDNGSPAAAASHAVFSAGYSSTPLQSNGFQGPNWMRLTIDLSGLGVTLGAGTWWASIVPVDETPGGDIYNWLGFSGGGNGLDAVQRGGGVAHGNGYPGLYPANWELPDPTADLSMRIEGTVVPAPCAMALLGLAGLTHRRRRNRA